MADTTSSSTFMVYHMVSGEAQSPESLDLCYSMIL